MYVSLMTLLPEFVTRKNVLLCGGPKGYFLKTFVNRGFSDGTSRVTSLGARQLDLCAIAEPSPHRFYSRIGGALYELDCSIMEPAVHSPNGPVLQANRRCAVRTGLFYNGTSGSLSERSGSTSE